jgi:hypothetical protein
MKIHKSQKIELIAADTIRPAIAHPFLEGDKLIATDGRRLVVLPVEREEGDSDGRVTEAALKAARKLTRKNESAQIKANGSFVFTAGSTLPRPNEDECGRFPNWRQLIPAEGQHPHFVTVNAKFLWEIAQALGADSIKIAIKDELSPVLVTSAQAPGAIAVLAPVRTT